MGPPSAIGSGPPSEPQRVPRARRPAFLSTALLEPSKGDHMVLQDVYTQLKNAFIISFSGIRHIQAAFNLLMYREVAVR